MFLPEHAIYKIAFYNGETDDWLPYAEDLIRKWSTQECEEILFPSTFEIILAAYLLHDDLLPHSAKCAFAKVMLRAVFEAQDNKLTLSCLHIHPPKPGRKQNRTELFIRYREVKSLIQDGSTATEAYKAVADKYCKSPDTIRRDYERFLKKAHKRQRDGEIKK